MKKFIIATSIVFTVFQFANSQTYSTALGLRLGFFNGVTVKHYIQESAALEGILSTRYRGFNITGLYELHVYDVFEVPRLNFYYGGGAHLGVWTDYSPYFKDVGTYPVIGVDGILGFEYNILEVPINISLDWKPALNLIGYYGFWADGGGLSVRYYF